METTVSFHTIDRTRTHPEEVSRNGKPADFIQEENGSNFVSGTRLSGVSPEISSPFSGRFRHICLIEAVNSASVVVLNFRSVI